MIKQMCLLGYLLVVSCCNMLMAPLSLLVQMPQRGYHQLIFILVTLRIGPLTKKKKKTR